MAVDMLQSRKVDKTVTITVDNGFPVAVTLKTNSRETINVMIGKISPNHLLSFFDKNICNMISPANMTSKPSRKNIVFVIVFYLDPHSLKGHPCCAIGALDKSLSKVAAQ